MNDSSDKNEKIMKNLSYKYLVLLIVLTISLIFSIIYLSNSIYDQIKSDEDYGGTNNDSNNIIGKDDNDDDDDDDDDNNDYNIVFSYYEKDNIGNGIKLINQYPVSDEVGKAFVGDHYVFEFRLYFNKNAQGLIYNILAEQLPETNLDSQYVKLYLESGTKVLDGILNDNNKVKTFTEYSKYNKNEKERILYKGTVSKTDAYRGYKDFVFKMWISEDLDMTDEYSNKTFNCRINVYARSAF